jgi:hypothetical protein
MKKSHRKRIFKLILTIFGCFFVMGLLFCTEGNKAYAVTYSNCDEVNPDLKGICYSDGYTWKDIKCQECTNLCNDNPQTHNDSKRCKWVNGFTNDYLPVPVRDLTIVETHH